MQKLLINMSRRRSLMVPVVTLVAIGIGISGYYIQNRQIVAREQAEQQAQKDSESSPQPANSSQLSTVDTVEESTKITEDGQPADVIAVELTVVNAPENSEVILSVKIDSKKSGVCAFYLKQGNYGPEETITPKDGKCEARLQNPGIGAWEAKVLYTSDDGKTRGDAKQDVQL